MADAIAAKSMFYINASYTNTTDRDRVAEIIIQDKSSMLERDQGWMTHITRWSLDTQNTLHYLDADPDKYYIHFKSEDPANPNNHADQLTWRATRNLNTVAALLNDVNTHIPVEVVNGLTRRLAHFTLDHEGRFVLRTSRGVGPNHKFLGVEPSEAMAKLLGWTQATNYVDWHNTMSTRARQLTRWYEAEMPARLRHQYLRSGDPNSWIATHRSMIDTFQFYISWAEGLAVANGGSQRLQAPFPESWGPGGVQATVNAVQVDPWLVIPGDPAGAQAHVQFTAFYHLHPALIDHDQKSRMIGVANRIDKVGRIWQINDSRTSQGPPAIEFPDGQPAVHRKLMNSILVTGESFEMRCLAVQPNSFNRVVLVCRRPGPDAPGGYHGCRWAVASAWR